MRTEKLSVNKVCMVVCVALFLLSVAMSCTIYFLTRNVLALCCGLLYAVFVAGCMAAFLAFVRRKLTLFSDALCKLLDDMMSADQAPPQYTEEENLFYKIQHRLFRLYEVLRESKSSIAKERADLQELISDISHQVKTPIANLKMLDATLLEQNVSSEKQREFLLAMDSQLDKLDRFIERRTQIVKRYNEAFAECPELVLQREIPESKTARHLYVIQLNPELLTCTRREFFDALYAENVHVQVHYLPVYWHSYYEKLGYPKGLCPNAEYLYEHVMSIPLFYSMTDEDVESVITAIKKVLAYYRR